MMPRPLLEIPTRTAGGATVGRPRKPCPSYTQREIRQQPPVDVCAIIEQLATDLCPIVKIARMLGTTREVLQRWMTDNPALQDAYDVGRAQAEQELVDIVLRDARDAEKPNINAFFLLKTRFGYREGDPGDQANRVSVTFNLPGALTLEQFAEAKNATPVIEISGTSLSDTRSA
jgi:hypothetical protein